VVEGADHADQEGAGVVHLLFHELSILVGDPFEEELGLQQLVVHHLLHQVRFLGDAPDLVYIDSHDFVEVQRLHDANQHSCIVDQGHLRLWRREAVRCDIDLVSECLLAGERIDDLLDVFELARLIVVLTNLIVNSVLIIVVDLLHGIVDW